MAKVLGHTLQNCKKLSPMNIKEGVDKAKVHKKAQIVITQIGPTAAGRLGGKQTETSHEIHHIEDVVAANITTTISDKEFGGSLSHNDSIETEGANGNACASQEMIQDQVEDPSLALHNSFALLKDVCDSSHAA